MSDEMDYRCDVFKERVGYRGQKFEHSCFDDDQDRRRVLGWSNTKDDPAFVAMVKHRPGWSQYQCVELQTEAQP
jgi:hypothetical protein